MAQSAVELILHTLDGFLTGPARIRLLGGAALILGYGMLRSTEDADLLEDDGELWRPPTERSSRGGST